MFTVFFKKISESVGKATFLILSFYENKLYFFIMYDTGVQSIRFKFVADG